MTDREKFEAWATDLGAKLGIGPPDLSVDARGSYVEPDLVAALACWQASRKQMAEEAAAVCDGGARLFGEESLVEALVGRALESAAQNIRSLATPTEGKK